MKLKSIVKALDREEGANEGGWVGVSHGSTRVCKEQCEEKAEYGLDILLLQWRWKRAKGRMEVLTEKKKWSHSQLHKGRGSNVVSELRWSSVVFCPV